MNKHFLRIIIALILLPFCSTSAEAGRPGEKVGVSIDTLVWDFGTIYENSPVVRHTFVLTNTGKDAVAILSATASCGCTKPKYDKKPVKPGESSDIQVSFVPTGQAGEVSKNVKVRLKNASGRSETVNLRLTGMVLRKKDKN